MRRRPVRGYLSRVVEVDRAVYRNGRKQACGDLSDTLAALRADGDGFLWIGLHDPTPAEFDAVNDELQLHPLAVEDAVVGNQRTKVESYEGGALFVSLHTLRYADSTSDVDTGEVMLFIGDRFVVTVRRGEGRPLRTVRENLAESPELQAAGPVGVLYAVMDQVVDDWVDVDAELGHDLEEIEQSVFADDGSTDANTIYRLKREVMEARRAVQPLLPPLRRIVDGELPQIQGESIAFFRDVLDHAVQVNEHVESYERLLTDILSAHLAQISVRQNDDMRKISAWVAIAAVPTAVSAIYGMNFDNMPELHMRYGYFVVVGLMLLASLLLWLKFKRSGWL